MVLTTIRNVLPLRKSRVDALSTPPPAADGRPTLRVVYRSADADNGKSRPDFHSKRTALLSLLRAAENVTGIDVRITFVNDGPLPADLTGLMRLSGRTVPVNRGSNRGSFRAAVAREATEPGDPADLVWFAEDDYLYTPGSLQAFVDAAAARPDADYFAMYGSDALDAERSTPGRPLLRERPGAEQDPKATALPAATWYRAESTTSTFGVRRRVLREDARLLRAAPFTGGAWDRTTCLALQGFRPFAVRDLLGDTPLGEPTTVSPRGLVRGALRAAALPALLRSGDRRRVLLGSDPELIRHMEVLDGTTRTRPPSAATEAIDWAALAAETRTWASTRGLDFPTAVTR